MNYEQQPNVNNNKLRTIWIFATGTRGDVQVYLALGVALKQRGYAVKVFTSQDFVSFVESFGLEAIVVRESNDTILYNNPKIFDSMKTGDTLHSFVGFAEITDKTASQTCHVLDAETAKSPPDLTLATPFMMGACWYMALKHKVPFINVFPLAVTYDPSRMQLGLPTLPFGLHYFLLYNALCPKVYDMNSAFGKSLMLGRGLEQSFPKHKYIQYAKDNAGLPAIILYSPEFAAALHPNPPPTYRFVGTTVLGREQQCSSLGSFGGSETMQRLEFFLNTGKKPVYVGWGSMVSKSSKHMVEFCARSIYHSQQRAIVCSGAANLSFETLKTTNVEAQILDYAKENILFVESAPHEWLFSRVATTVHHGGAGTTTCALRAGIPTIITPVWADQYDQACLVERLQVGVGFEKQLQKISWRELGEAIRTVLSDKAMAERASALGEKLCAEDGANVAVDEIESYWSDHCATGKFHDTFPGKEDKTRVGIFRTVVTITAIIGCLAYAATILQKSSL